MQLHIRYTSNAACIIRVLHAAFERYRNDLMPSSALLETVDTMTASLHAGQLVLGGYVDDILVAIVKLKQMDNTLYFSRLAVHPHYQRQRIASLLLSYIEQEARHLQCETVTCDVRKSEAVNVQFYRQHGYTIASEQLTTSPAGYTMPTYTFIKKVAR